MLSIRELFSQERTLLQRPLEQRYYIAKRECNATRRCVLVNWMSEVAAFHHMHRESFHLAVSLLDRFLELQNVPKSHLQLFGAACLLISGKLKVCLLLLTSL